MLKALAEFRALLTMTQEEAEEFFADWLKEVFSD